jgi:hypothetical protein
MDRAVEAEKREMERVTLGGLWIIKKIHHGTI